MDSFSAARPICRRRSPLIAVVAAALFALAAQGASTSPVQPTAVLVHGVEPVGPELQRVEVGASERLRVRAAPAVEPTTSTGSRARSTIAASATAMNAGAAAGATTAASVAGTTAAMVISSIATDLSPEASTSLAASSPTDGSRNSTVTATSTSSSSISTSTAVPAGYKLPQAFDSTLGTNFTSTACPSFFATFLADPTFQSCAPFSLLLTTSTAFFKAERSPFGLLPYVLNASCSASQADCAATMSTLVHTIQLKNTCGPDLALGNPLATEALQGFQNYAVMREAGCARSNTTERYCFAEASANTDPSDLYYYYLAEGTTLPSGTMPTCDYCTQNLLGIFARYATNSTLAISRTYTSGRSAAALACGPDFAPALAVQSKVSAAMLHQVVPLSAALFALAAAAVVFGVDGS